MENGGISHTDVTRLYDRISDVSFAWRAFAIISLFVLLACFSYFYPALNWPDEAYKIEQIRSSSNPYLSAVGLFIDPTCPIAWIQDDRVGFGNNEFQFSITSGRECYNQIKTVHLAFAIALILVVLLRISTEKAWVFTVSLLLPMGVFFLSGVNNQLIFHITSTLFGVLLIKGGRPWVLMLFAILLLPFDRTFVTLIVFLASVMALRTTKKWSLVGFVLVLLVFQLNLLPFNELAMIFIGIENLSAVQASLDRFNDGIILSLGLFFVSMVYLGGTTTIFGFGPEYLIVLVVLIIGYVKMENRQDFHVYFLAFLATYVLILKFTPTIQGYRYYVFVTPVLLYHLAPKLRHQQYIVFYSILMSVAYLCQAIVIDAFL